MELIELTTSLITLLDYFLFSYHKSDSIDKQFVYIRSKYVENSL